MKVEVRGGGKKEGREERMKEGRDVRIYYEENL